MHRRALFNRLLPTVLAVLLCCLPLLSAGAEEAEEEGDITGACSFLASSSRISFDALFDGDAKTKVSLSANDWFSLQWPAHVKAQGLYLLWLSLPGEYIVEQRDHAGLTISSAVFVGGMTQEYIPLDATCGMVLLFSREKAALSDICLCAADAALPARVHDWRPPAEKADLMLVAALPGDVAAIFRGIPETYAVERALPFVLVYLGRSDAPALNAALDALWALGVRDRPVVGSYGEKHVDLLTRLEGGGTEQDYATAFVTEQLRRYRPLVLVSHAEGGEDGKTARAEAYRAARQAAALADNAEMFPESAEAYGLWRASKLYLHDFSGPQTVIDGVTYGLVSSTVGPDTALDDLFENIPETAYAGYVPPAATPMPEEAAEPGATPMPGTTPTPRPLPTPTPAPTEIPDSVRLRRVSAQAWLVLVALLFIILVLVIILIVRVTLEWRRTGVPGLKKNRQPEEEKKDE